MRSESLQYFLEIAECGSFTSASKRLYVSQQGLSKSIKALEKDLGCRLFQRDGSKLSLSDAGRALIPHARRCLADVADLKSAMEPFGQMSSPGRAERTDRITLHATAFVADSLFSLMDDALRRAGLTNVRIIEHSSDEILDQLRTGEDAALCALCLPVKEAQELASAPGIEFRPLFSTEIMLAGSSQFIHKDKGAFKLDRVARMPIVYYNDPTLNRIIGDMFAEHELENVITHAASPARITRSIQQGKAVTFTDSLTYYLAGDDEGTSCAPIEGAAEFVVGFARAADLPSPEGVQEYADAFEACFRVRCASYLEEHPLPAL